MRAPDLWNVCCVLRDFRLEIMDTFTNMRIFGVLFLFIIVIAPGIGVIEERGRWNNSLLILYTKNSSQYSRIKYTFPKYINGNNNIIQFLLIRLTLQLYCYTLLTLFHIIVIKGILFIIIIRITVLTCYVGDYFILGITNVFVNSICSR